MFNKEILMIKIIKEFRDILITWKEFYLWLIEPLGN